MVSILPVELHHLDVASWTSEVNVLGSFSVGIMVWGVGQVQTDLQKMGDFYVMDSVGKYGRQ